MNYSLLLKIKHLFYSSIVSGIDYRPILSSMGVKLMPVTIDQLKALSISRAHIGIINGLYFSQRSVDMSHKNLNSVYNRANHLSFVNTAMRMTGVSISDI